jgi:hypothetical protein
MLDTSKARMSEICFFFTKFESCKSVAFKQVIKTLRHDAELVLPSCLMTRLIFERT